MDGIIESDFEVNAIAQNDDMDFFWASKNVFYHFVFLLKKDGYNEIKQYYIPRFQIANWLYNNWEKDGEFILDLPESGISLILENQIDLEAIKISDDFNIVIVYRDNTIYFPLKENSFGEILLKDYELLTKVYADSVKKPFRKKVISKIIGAFDETVIYPFSDQALLMAAFENKLITSKRRWSQLPGINQLLELEYKDSNDYDFDFYNNFHEALSMVVGIDSCDCTGEACFFDLLKTAYTTFFNETALLTEGELDDTKVDTQFAAVWHKLAAKQRTLLRFLDSEFGNTPLLNLYLLTANADMEDYIYKMTYPYQPDSEDDAFVRSIASLVGYYNRTI